MQSTLEMERLLKVHIFEVKKTSLHGGFLYLGLEQITYKISFKNSVGKSWIT